jgi:hypothetical protein
MSEASTHDAGRGKFERDNARRQSAVSSERRSRHMAAGLTLYARATSCVLGQTFHLTDR